MADVTDATFEQAVLTRSEQVPVVVDLWAPWCGPCQTLGPMLESAVTATDGAVELAKVNVDDNPQVSAMFQVQSIPAVFALRDRKVVNAFMGAVPEAQVAEFVAGLLDQPSEADQLVAVGDEASLRLALELVPDHEGAIVSLARILLDGGDADGALEVLARIPETALTRPLAAEARLAERQVDLSEGTVEALLDGLLERIPGDDDARREFLDVLEAFGPEDPRVATYRKALSLKLY
jgi:putative thioredoxin